MLTVTPARYAKGKMAARPSVDGSGFKNSEHRLCEAIGGKWSGRCKAYIVSPAQARDLLILAAAGWDAYVVFRQEDGEDFTHRDLPIDSRYTRKQALALCPQVTKGSP